MTHCRRRHFTAARPARSRYPVARNPLHVVDAAGIVQRDQWLGDVFDLRQTRHSDAGAASPLLSPACCPSEPDMTVAPSWATLHDLPATIGRPLLHPRGPISRHPPLRCRQLPPRPPGGLSRPAVLGGPRPRLGDRRGQRHAERCPRPRDPRPARTTCRSSSSRAPRVRRRASSGR